jgi:hypothetical protein
VAERDPKTGQFPKGNGAGWGGPKKGASTSRIRKGDPEGIQRMSNDPDVKAAAAERIATLKEHLFTLARNAERQETQLAATVAYLNRELGTPAASVSAQVSGANGGPIHYVIDTGIDRD